MVYKPNNPLQLVLVILLSAILIIGINGQTNNHNTTNILLQNNSKFHSAQDQDYPEATFTSLPTTFNAPQRHAIFSINCLRNPSWCHENAKYSFNGEWKCKEEQQTEACKWTVYYQWFDQDYHFLAPAQSNPEDITAIPEIWSQLDPEVDRPDIALVIVTATTQDKCKCKPQVLNEPAWTTKGTFSINDQPVVEDISLTVSPDPYLFTGVDIPHINVTYSYRFPPNGFADNRKRLGWNLEFPPHTQDQLKKMTDIEFIPHGLIQFAENDKDAQRMFNNMRCYWGDVTPAHLTKPEFLFRKNDGESYWSFRLPFPADPNLSSQPLPFVLDCSSYMDGDHQSKGDWIVQNFISQTHTLSLRFLNADTYENPINAHVIQFIPVQGRNPLHVVDLVVFDEVVQHNNIVPISPIIKAQLDDTTVVGRWQLATPDSKANGKGGEIPYLNTYSFDIEFEKFGDNQLDFFHQYSPLAQNSLTIDLTAIELDQKYQPEKITATYTISCDSTPVGAGLLEHAMYDEYPTHTYPTMRFTDGNTVWEFNEKTTDDKCLNTMTFSVHFSITIETKFMIEDTSKLFHSTAIITTSPTYQIGPDTITSTTSFQLSASTRGPQSSPPQPPPTTLPPAFLTNDFVLSTDNKEDPKTHHSEKIKWIDFHTLWLHIEEPYIQTESKSVDFQLGIVGIGHYFHHDPNTDEDDQPQPTFKCKFNGEYEDSAIILNPHTLHFTFAKASWTKTTEKEPHKITCPGLKINVVNYGNSTHPRPTEDPQSVLISFKQYATNTPTPHLVQYLSQSMTKSSRSHLFLVAILAVIIMVVVIAIIALVKQLKKNKSSQLMLDEAQTEYISID